MLSKIDMEKIDFKNLSDPIPESMQTSILSNFSSSSYQPIENLILNDNLELRENIK